METLDVFLTLLGVASAFFFLLVVAFFSGAETALISLNRLKLRSMADAGFRNAKILHELMSQPEMLVSSMLLGLNISVVVGSAITSALLIHLVGPGHENLGVFLTTLIVTPVYLVFGELIPKTICRQRADKLAMKYARPIQTAYNQFYYFIAHATWISMKLKRFINRRSTREEALFMTKEEIMMLIKMSESDGVIKKAEGRMISQVFLFNKLLARDVMTPRKDIVAVSIDTKIEDLVGISISKGFSRILVFEDSIDNIKGFVYVLDLVRQDYRGKSTRDLLRKSIYVPETKKTSILLREMQAQKLHMAIVVDEYGGTAGVVAMEDLVEEIVGEIQDEYDADEPDFIKIDEHTFLVNAMMDIEDAVSELKIELDPCEDIQTIGGYIINLAGRVPVLKEEILHKNLKFIVEKAEKQRIKKVKIIKIPPPPQGGQDAK